MTEPETVKAPATTLPPAVDMASESRVEPAAPLGASGGRKRSPAEIRQGKKAAAFLRELKRDEALLGTLVSGVIPAGGAITRQVCVALGKLVRREHGLTLGSGALRHVIQLASDARLVHRRKHGNAVRWFASAGPATGADKRVAAKTSMRAAKSTAKNVASTVAMPVNVPRPQMAEPAVLPELEVMAATNAMLTSLNAAEQQRVLTWLADRYAAGATTDAKKAATGVLHSGVTPTRVAVVKQAAAKQTRPTAMPVKPAPVASAKKAAVKPTSNKRSKPSASPVKFGAAVFASAVTAKPVTGPAPGNKASLAELSKVLKTKKPGSGTELFLVLIDHLAAEFDGGPATRDVAVVVKAARLKMSNPSYSGFAAREQGLARQAGGRWQLTPAGEKRLKAMGKK